jgi:hypothetical protein
MLQEKDCEHDLKGKGQYPAEQIKRTGKRDTTATIQVRAELELTWLQPGRPSLSQARRASS